MELWYGDIRLGTIDEFELHQGTWLGIFHAEFEPDASAQAQRVSQFIRFSEEWNEDEATGTHPPGAEDWDAYNDVIYSGLWFTRDTDGAISRIKDAPVFFARAEGYPGSEISWLAVAE